MSQHLEELPLYPLRTVLFPYAQIQLHVFEERYVALVRKCAEEDLPFGVVLIRSGEDEAAEPYLVGTAVRIESIKDYEDGRLDVQVTGERRFRIRELDEGKPYPVAKVEPVVEMEPSDAEKAAEVLELAQEKFRSYVRSWMEHEGVRIDVRFPTDPVVMSFTMANMLPLENLERQRLLETTNTVERIEGLLPAMDKSCLEVSPGKPTRRLRLSDLGDWISPN